MRLVARDGFNGVELWKRPMSQWSEWQTGSIKSIPTQQQRCLAAVGRTVYVCSGFGGSVMAFAIRTGAPKQVYEQSNGTTEFAIVGNVLYAMVVYRGRPLQEINFDAAPVWDRIAIAHDSYFICLKDGSVVCLSAK